MQGVTQGPCSISEFRGWMHDLRTDPQLSFQYKQFSEVSAWRVSAMSHPCAADLCQCFQEVAMLHSVHVAW